MGPTLRSAAARPTWWSPVRRGAAIAALVWACSSCGGGNPTQPGNNPPPGGNTTPPTGQTGVLVGAGDIAVCDDATGKIPQAGAVATAKLLDSLTGTVFAAGDNAYLHGSVENYKNCYDPTWGRHKARTRPVPGNHEYETPGAAPYYAYFGDAAGPSGQGYYRYSVGPWTILGLNSEVDASAGSAQVQWLRNELTTNPAPCVAAIWHRPRFTSGPNGDATDMAALWQALYDLNVDVIINGHDHLYERFDPQDPQGRPDGVRGIRQFTVGTGGASLYLAAANAKPNSVVRISAWGVARFTLTDGAYQWDFLPVEPGASVDSGNGRCH